MSEIDRDELRRLLGEAELPWTIEQTTPNMGGPNWLIRREGKAGIIVSAHEYGFYGRGEVITAAVNALPSLLDALDKAEAHRDSLAAALIEVQREKLALVERVRELHTPGDEWCGYHNSALCECANVYCEECGSSWPCPTIQALDVAEAHRTAPRTEARPMPDLRAMLGDRYEALASAISATASDWLGTPYSPHGWRCEDETRYPCGHDGEMADEVMGVLEAILPGLLAQAWDEGARSASQCASPTGRCARDGWDCDHPNPYRQEG